MNLESYDSRHESVQPVNE